MGIWHNYCLDEAGANGAGDDLSLLMAAAWATWCRVIFPVKG